MVNQRGTRASASAIQTPKSIESDHLRNPKTTIKCTVEVVIGAKSGSVNRALRTSRLVWNQATWPSKSVVTEVVLHLSTRNALWMKRNEDLILDSLNHPLSPMA